MKVNKHEKSENVPFAMFTGFEWLRKILNYCKNNPENLLTRTLDEHISSASSVTTMLSFKSIENKHDVYRHKDYMKKFLESWREYPVAISTFRKKEMDLLTQKHHKSDQTEEIFDFLKKSLTVNMLKIKYISKVRDHCHYGGQCRGLPKEIPITFCNCSNYKYLIRKS